MSPHSGADGLVQGELPPSTWMLTVFTSLACYPGAPLTATETRLAWAGIGEDCRPRTTWRPLTLAGSPVLPPCTTHWRYCHADKTVPRQDVNSSFPSCVCHSKSESCSHTRRFGTLASPPPPIVDTPWGPHPPGHPFSDL